MSKNIVTQYVQASPATVYVMGEINNHRLSLAQRLTLLTVGNLADAALFSPDGYDGNTAKEVELLTADGATVQHLVSLVNLGLLELRVGRDGEMRYRVPQSAFDAANEA